MVMTIDIDVRSARLFESDLMNKGFQDLFYPHKYSEVPSEKGPLKIILEEYLLVPAKGGSAVALKDWSDMTYFTHVLNAMVISGKLLDYTIKKQYDKNPGASSELEKYIRLFFTAVAMHDADKLFREGIYGSNNLDIVLEKNKQSIVKICSYYLKPLGPPSEWWNDLVFLILRTENRTMDYANNIETRLKRTELATISQYVKLGDQLGGIKSNMTDSIFSRIKELILPYVNSLGEQINLIHFSDLPQILLLDRLNSNFERFLRQSDRHVIVNFPDAIAFIGPPLNVSELERICSAFSEEMDETEKNVVALLDNFAPSGNSIRLDFSREIQVTPKVVKTYIEKFNGRLLIWQGEDWKNANPDFDVKSRMIGVPIMKGVKKGKPFFYLQLPEESREESDEETQRRRMLGLIACAQRTLFACVDQSENDIFSKEEQKAYSAFGKEVFDKADALQRKTIEAISHAGGFYNEPLKLIEEEYDKICNSVSSILVPRFEKDKTMDYNEFFSRATGLNFLIQDPPDKSSMCVYCGIFAENPLKEENSFGIKATSGTGRKITVLKYDENKFNGRICKYCLRENTLRRKEIGKESEALCVHVYLGDYYAPVNLEKVVDSLKEISSRTSEIRIEHEKDENYNEKLVIHVGKRSKRDLRYHMIFFMRKPRKRVEEFYLISNVLDFILKTGTKIRLTSLMSSKRIFTPMFQWDNAPSWVKNLSMDEVRIDRLESVNKELILMYNISKISGSKNALAWVIHDANRGKRGIFQILWRSILGNSGDKGLNKYPNVKEGVEWYMDKYEKEVNKTGMERIVDEACGISTRAPVSNNDNTWMFREAMELYLRHFRNEDADLKQKIAGKIWDYANRQKFSGRETQSHCLGFSDAFVDLMRSEFKNRIPTNDYRKDLISQFALMYNIEKWKRVKNRKGEGNE
jgi:hypothetical protein